MDFHFYGNKNKSIGVQNPSKRKQDPIEMDNRNPNLKYYVQLMYFLSAEERHRPISEQFPFTRCDIDILLKATENLEKSTSRLERSSKNKSNEM